MFANEQTNERTCLLYTLSQARSVTENDFDNLVARLYILKANKIMEPNEMSSALSSECCTLHLTAAILKDTENRTIIFGLRHDNGNMIHI